jgi:hypothetical protein
MGVRGLHLAEVAVRGEIAVEEAREAKAGAEVEEFEGFEGLLEAIGEC